MAFFDDGFVTRFAADPVANTIIAYDSAMAEIASRPDWTDADDEIIGELYALMLETSEAGKYPFESRMVHWDTVDADSRHAVNAEIKEIYDACKMVNKKITLDSHRRRFQSALGSGFVYEFTQGDLERVQELINQLRDLITASDVFEAEHKRRLLKRLEKLQSQLHKKMSDLDHLWGLVGDMGVMLGKFGTDAKPFVDRIEQIARIVWSTQARAEELSSDSAMPKLEHNPAAGNEEKTDED